MRPCQRRRHRGRGNVGCVLGHEGRPFADCRVAVAPEIGEDQAVTRFEGDCHRIPEFVVTGKGMEENDGWAAPANLVEDLGIVAAQVFHGRRL